MTAPDKRRSRERLLVIPTEDFIEATCRRYGVMVFLTRRASREPQSALRDRRCSRIYSASLKVNTDEAAQAVKRRILKVQAKKATATAA
jgi:hypothetical protein